MWGELSSVLRLKCSTGLHLFLLPALTIGALGAGGVPGESEEDAHEWVPPNKAGPYLLGDLPRVCVCLLTHGGEGGEGHRVEGPADDQQRHHGQGHQRDAPHSREADHKARHKARRVVQEEPHLGWTRRQGSTTVQK